MSHRSSFTGGIPGGGGGGGGGSTGGGSSAAAAASASAMMVNLNLFRSSTTDSNETYLESFIEHISTLPSEIRRNLDLMKDLDKSCSTLFEEMTRLQQEYVNQVEDKISQLQVVTTQTVIDETTGEEKIVPLDKPHILNTSTTASQSGKKSSRSSRTTTNSNNKRQRDGSDDGEEDDNDNIENDDDDEQDDDEEEQEGAAAGAASRSSSKNAAVASNIMIPTTEELSHYVHNQPNYIQIEKLYEDTLQRAEEKVTIAQQTYALVDATCRRLDANLFELEHLLQATGEFQALGTTGRQNDLAAIQVNLNSPETWILAKVITHDPQTGMYKLSDEDIESSKTFTLPESQVVILGGLTNLSRGDIVYAVYPDTTAFYQATVVQTISTNSGGSGGSSNKKQGGGSSSRGGDGTGDSGSSAATTFVMVNFVDDSDEHGITHDKAVLLQHVMLPPYGVPLQ